MARPKLDAPNHRLVLRGSRYYVRWWESGAWQRISTGTGDERAARRYLAQHVAAHGTALPPAKPTIAEILDHYLADREGHVAGLDTIRHGCDAVKRYLGDLEADHLTRERCRWFVRQRRAAGQMIGPAHDRRKKPIGDGVIIRNLTTLRAALALAVKAGWIDRAPHIEMPSAPPAKDRWLTWQEAERLLEGAEAPHIRTFIALALNTAGRATAIRQLTWDRVDFDAGLISLGRGTGNKRRATVPMNERLLPVLRDARRLATCDHVVEYRSGPVASTKTGFAAAARRAGLKGVSAHTLRHTAATWMVQGGTSLTMVAFFLGDRVETVERVYAHHHPDYLRDAAKALAGGGLTGPVAPETKIARLQKAL